MRPSRPSSSEFARAIDCRFLSSPYLRGCWLVLHGLAGWVLLYLPGPRLQMMATILVLASGLLSARLPGCGWTGKALARASRHEDGSWTLVERSGREFQAWLDHSHVAASRLIFVSWMSAEGTRSAILMPGLVEASALRRLRVILAASGRP